MKIISGKFKGRTLDGYNLDGTRPTMDRVKESLFASIQFDIKDKVVLDLFSGSGNLGLEALSNGSKYIYLVDHNRKAVNVIKDNIKKLNITDSYTIINKDYRDALKQLNSENKKMDIIFLDPPYDTNYVNDSLLLIDKLDLVSDDGLIICESNSLDKIKYSDKFTEIKNKKYGDKYIVILKKI